MNVTGTAYALATAIYPFSEGAEERIYTVVDALGYTDEKKADLYAQLAEKLMHDTPFERAVALIEAALTRTEARFG